MIQFHKYVAAGNDFVIFNAWDRSFEIESDVIKTLCDRRFGIGADGVMLLGRASDHDFQMHYYNADGSRGQMCGNGARSLVKYAYSLDKIPAMGSFLADDGAHMYQIENDRVEVEILVNDKLREWDLPYSGSGIINTGVPHLVAPVEKIDNDSLDTLGRQMNSHPAHPEGTNLNIISRVSEKLFVRTWERGVNRETLACGTGAVAASIYVHEKWHHDWPIVLSFKGGDLGVDFRHKQFWLSGAAELVFVGQIALSKVQNL